MDLFDELLNIEEQYYQQGRIEGEQKGSREGHEEGYTFGVAKGRQIGEELGHVSGLVEHLLHMHESGDTSFPWSERLVKNLTLLRDLIAQFPYDQPHNDEYNIQLENIRGKYKLLEIRLKVILKKKNEETEINVTKQNQDTLSF